ncbi:MAG: multidrug efflux SMR transporter [Prochlorococcus sp.]
MLAPDSGQTPSNRRRAFFELLLAIASEQVGTSAMKASEGFSLLMPTALAVIGYCFSLFWFGRSMRVLPMGFAYALWVGLGMVCSSLVGIILFGEMLHLSVIAGLLIVGAGILVLNSAQEASV